MDRFLGAILLLRMVIETARSRKKLVALARVEQRPELVGRSLGRSNFHTAKFSSEGFLYGRMIFYRATARDKVRMRSRHCRRPFRAYNRATRVT